MENVGISFCTTCANRLHQLRQTYDRNVDTLGRYKNVEWVIVNYGSNDGMDDFMAHRLKDAPQAVVYARLTAPLPWHASVAKNVAHRAASLRCLVNLDCDNLFGDAVDRIVNAWHQGARVMHLWSGVYGDGTCGRIAMDRDIFFSIGGYDEEFHPMGFQDRDLLRRASALGYAVVHMVSSDRLAVQNTKRESIKLCRKPGFSYKEYDRLNMMISNENIRLSRFVANAGLPWGAAKLQIVNAKT